MSSPPRCPDCGGALEIQRCVMCKGTGRFSSGVPCLICKGHGRYYSCISEGKTIRSMWPPEERTHPCPVCGGTGKIRTQHRPLTPPEYLHPRVTVSTCTRCGGTGRIRE